MWFAGSVANDRQPVRAGEAHLDTARAVATGDLLTGRDALAFVNCLGSPGLKRRVDALALVRPRAQPLDDRPTKPLEVLDRLDDTRANGAEGTLEGEVHALVHGGLLD